MTLLNVDVVKAVRADVRPSFIRDVLTRAAAVPEVAARLPDAQSTVAVRLTADAEMQRLNTAYAGEPHSTDVLSFAGSAGHVGDIAISWPATLRQAAEYGHDATAELALLAVHGLLHLLGWDHISAREEKEMTRLTIEALQQSGIELAPRRL
ncbi:MAG: rRNA maturation RNase YbeY [Chloroflexi bacterium]|nr:MAG: rRNA maturation RNase YbeY [Chloroflexota bacterium]TMF82758.1 MAG: rRNA maturation RNase YbeY [Chloroflexota bacterium]TMG12434.1 MAG: rRNA maturation RNase YbeY [Chloroflexota bacterium]